jgi:DNA-binding LytR/AlgR family response regulator
VNAPLRVLAVDDEPLALAELGFLLGEHPRVGSVQTACDGVETLRLLKTETYDVVLLDVSMPGLDGVEVAEIMRHLPECPAVVFVTAHEERAAEAFGLDAADYVLKPVSAPRLDDAIRRVERRLASSGLPSPDADDLSIIPVESEGSTRFVHRRDVVYAEAHGDYVRLRTVGRDGGLHTVRMSLTTLSAASSCGWPATTSPSVGGTPASSASSSRTRRWPVEPPATRDRDEPQHPAGPAERTTLGRVATP